MVAERSRSIAHNLNVLFNRIQKKRLVAVLLAARLKMAQNITISKNVFIFFIQKLVTFLKIPKQVFLNVPYRLSVTAA